MSTLCVSNCSEILRSSLSYQESQRAPTLLPELLRAGELKGFLTPYLRKKRPAKRGTARMPVFLSGRLQSSQVGVDHHPDQLLKGNFRFPPKRGLGFGRVAYEKVDLGGLRVERMTLEDVYLRLTGHRAHGDGAPPAR